MQKVAVLVTLVAAGVSMLTWYRHREGPGLRGWALAMLLSSAGTYLFCLRDPAATFRFILLGDGLFVAGFATMWMSLRRFNDPAVTGDIRPRADGPRTLRTAIRDLVGA